MGKFPFICFQKELLFRQLYAISLCEHTDDLLEFFFLRRAKIDRNSEPCHEGQFFLYRIICMKFLIPVCFISECFADQMAAV